VHYRFVSKSRCGWEWRGLQALFSLCTGIRGISVQTRCIVEGVETTMVRSGLRAASGNPLSVSVCVVLPLRCEYYHRTTAYVMLSAVHKFKNALKIEI